MPNLCLISYYAFFIIIFRKPQALRGHLIELISFWEYIIRIDNQEQTKLFQYIPMATLNDEMVEWLMNESKSRLKTFYGIEEYEVYRNNEFKKIMEETDEIEND